MSGKVFIVARLARVIAVDVPHHVTQRGNARRFILDCDADRQVYLDLLRQNIEVHGVGSDRLLPDVESRASDRCSSQWRGSGISPKACTWSLCGLLECGSSIERPCMAGSLLLLPAGSGAFMGGTALCGVEPAARRLGDRGRSLGLVQRFRTLRDGSTERTIGFRAMAELLDCQCLATVSCRRREGIHAGRDSSLHSHREAAG